MGFRNPDHDHVEEMYSQLEKNGEYRSPKKMQEDELKKANAVKMQEETRKNEKYRPLRKIIGVP